MKYERNERVYISGCVYYGDTGYRVACNGTIIEDYGDMYLICLDEIDGDINTNVLVEQKYIHEIT